MTEQPPVLSWLTAGILVGLLLIAATALVKPLGVSTQYAVTDALVLHKVAPKFTESNEYLNKYGEKENWSVGYGWMLVLGMGIGGFLAALFTGRLKWRAIPEMWQINFGEHRGKRRMQAFTGGVLLLFGARFAGGCTSGHMISGISQLAVSSFVFGIAIFASGIIVARILYRRGAQA